MNYKSDSWENERSNIDAFFDITPIGMLVLDENMIIKKANDIAVRQIRKNCSDVINTKFGNGFGCKYSLEDNAGCGHGEHCASCNVFNNINKVITNGETIRCLEMEQPFAIKGKEIEPWFVINSKPIIIDGKKCALIIMDCITEKKTAEETVIRSRDFYITLLEGLDLFIRTADKEGKCTYVNKKWLDFTQSTSEQNFDRGWTNSIHEEDLNNAYSEYIEAVNKRKKYEIVYRVRGKEGTYRWVCDSGSPYSDKYGNYEGYISMCTDITEHIEYEEVLSRYQVLSENINDIILLFNTNGDIIEANAAAVKTYGYTYEELTSMSVYQIREKALTFKEIEIAFQKGIILQGIHKRKDGSTFPVETSLTMSVIGGKNVFLSIVRDISERKKAQRALYESERHLRQITDNMLDILLQTDLQGNITYASQSYERILGYSLEQVLGKSIIHRIHPEDREHVANVFKTAIQTKQPGMAESRYIRSDGSYIWIESIGEILLNEENEAVGAIIVSRDITVRKKAEEEVLKAKEAAENANRAKSEFLANMSHEIRTPLNGMLGMIDLTLLTELSAKQKENLNIAKGCASNLLTIINDILDFSKIEAGKMIVENLEFDVRNVIEKVVEGHLVTAFNKGLKLSYNISSDVQKSFIGDPNRLKQILNNLLSNAIKFTEIGSVTVGVEKSKRFSNALEISVVDTGIGIDNKDLNKLFKSFSQVDSSITRKYGGTGLGLAISNRLVKIMGGTMQVESEKGKGSKFSFILQSGLNADAKEENVSKNQVQLQIRSNLNILLAEDDLVNQMLTKEMLMQKGYNTDIASNGREAVELFAKGNYDLVLMDVQMPEMDGIKATEIIRKKEKKSKGHIPIIALTAHALQGDRERFLTAGMDEYLSKPFDINSLYEVINNIVYTKEKVSVKDEVQRNKTYQVNEICNFEDKEYNSKTFILNSIKQIKNIKRVLGANDIYKAEQLAHALKLKASELSEDLIKNEAFKIELSLRRGDLGDAYEAVKILEMELLRRNEEKI